MATFNSYVNGFRGAIPKDGPSAGVATTLALASLLLERGEPTLAVFKQWLKRCLVIPRQWNLYHDKILKTTTRG